MGAVAQGNLSEVFMNKSCDLCLPTLDWLPCYLHNRARLTVGHVYLKNSNPKCVMKQSTHNQEHFSK